MKEILKNLAYSTNKDLMKEAEEEQTPTLDPKDQPLKVQKNTKHRGGKTVSIILGFAGSDDNREALCKKLKVACGTGGASKDGEIIIQGDHVQKIAKWLKDNGYSKAKAI
jgi:translation initiation factor 1